ncbi:MAG: hypothetical protein PHE29_12760 [Tissierellia bacterium]|nr:hypothetical protein [Tissierellia bacterium]
MIHNFVIVVLVILPYFLVSWALIGVSAWIVNRIWIDLIEVKPTQQQYITAEPKHFRKVA